MELSIKSLASDREAYMKAGVKIPSFDIAALQERTAEKPVWLHFGAGNIFRGFIASLQQDLIEQGLQDRGIQTLSAHDGAIIDEVYRPHDCLTLGVTLLPDGKTELEVIASVTHGFKLNGTAPEDEQEALRLAAAPSLQMISYTITEKGYSLRGIDGKYTKLAISDFDQGPERCRHAMSLTARLLLARYKAGELPIALVSMDNCSHNGDKLHDSVITVAKEWMRRGFVDEGFVSYLQDKSKVSFPWTMIDKITPRPDPEIAKRLRKIGLRGMEPIKTARGSFIAPFVNAEKPQYLVIEDDFPAGRPQLEKAGVLFTDAKGVDLCERMKVTTCLNPLHTALAVTGCLLGYTRISAEMDDPILEKLVRRLGYDEGLPVVEDPGILSPRDFLTEVIEQRLPNKCLPDSPQRIATDTSQKVPIRFGETIKNYRKLGRSTKNLVALPLAIAAWMRYLLGVDDRGRPFELSDDPQKEALQAELSGVVLGKPESLGRKLRPILSNEVIFGCDLYKAGIGEKVEEYVREMLEGPGAVRRTLEHALA
jgi:fructuronate reductase